MTDVIVVGGGISGLTAAFKLKKQGYDVLLLEEQETPGGNIKTIASDGSRMETGPHSFMGSSEYTWKLVDELGIHDAVEPASATSKNRYIYRHKKLKPLPMSFLSFLGTTLLSPAAKLRLMMEPFIRNGAKDDDTAWEFFRRRFGKEAATYIMSPFVSGVYAGDVKILGARAAFAKFWNFEKDSGSMIKGAFKYMKNKKKRLKKEGIKTKRGLFSFEGGLGKITSALAEWLDGHIETGVSVESIRKQENGDSGGDNGGDNGKSCTYIVEGSGKTWKAPMVVIATPPPMTGKMLNPMVPQLEETFNSIPMSPVILIHWRVKDPEGTYPNGFGFLMPRLFNLRVLGTLFPSRLFKDRTADGYQLFATFYGGMTDPDALKMNDKEIVELLLKEHRKIFRRDLEGAEIIKIIRYPSAIPQLLPNHPETIAKIKTTLTKETPGIFLAGNYLTGVGIEHAAESGYRAFEELNASGVQAPPGRGSRLKEPVRDGRPLDPGKTSYKSK